MDFCRYVRTFESLICGGDNFVHPLDSSALKVVQARIFISAQYKSFRISMFISCDLAYGEILTRGV